MAWVILKLDQQNLGWCDPNEKKLLYNYFLSQWEQNPFKAWDGRFRKPLINQYGSYFRSNLNACWKPTDRDLTVWLKTGFLRNQRQQQKWMVFGKNSKLQVSSARVNAASHDKPSMVAPADGGVPPAWEGGNRKLCPMGTWTLRRGEKRQHLSFLLEGKSNKYF